MILAWVIFFIFFLCELFSTTFIYTFELTIFSLKYLLIFLLILLVLSVRINFNIFWGSSYYWLILNLRILLFLTYHNPIRLVKLSLRLFIKLYLLIIMFTLFASNKALELFPCIYYFITTCPTFLKIMENRFTIMIKTCLIIIIFIIINL